MQTMQIEQPIDANSPILFEFDCSKKGKNQLKHYRAKLYKDSLNLYHEKISQPKYQLPIQLQTHIKWETVEELRNGKKYYKLVSFKFQQVKHDKQSAKISVFMAEEQELYKLKEHLRNKIIFQRIQDFYTPLQTLGKGSSSRVLLVRHKNTELYYAAKCVDKSYINETENGIASMFQEITLNNELHHPSFIKLHAVYEGDNTFYMVMDLLEGRSLHDELQNHKNGFPDDIVKNIMMQILKGISYMHQKNIMHRDLKPENIMMLKKSDLQSLKIVDFGLATHCDIDKYIFPKCGTPGYVAPEIANLVDKTQKYDKVCDIFSAGVIFFKLFTGKDLFSGNGFNQVLKLNKLCKVDLTPLQMKKVDQNIIALIQKMVEKEPQNRPSAEECLQHPFFEEKKDNSQKKQFFKTLKNDSKSLSLTHDALNTVDEMIKIQTNDPKNPLTLHQVDLHQVKKEDQQSFVTQDNAYKAIKQAPNHKRQKFNTTEFNNQEMNTLQEEVQKIEEEPEDKADQ